MVELLAGPSGVYLLFLLGFLGVVLLVIAAARGKFKGILASFAVSVGAGILGVYTGTEIFVLLTLLGLFSMLALGKPSMFFRRSCLQRIRP